MIRPICLIQKLIVVFMIVGCGTTANITSDEDSIEIALEDVRNFNDAMEEAASRAEKHCNQYEKTAKLERVDKAGANDRSAIAYFICK